VNNRAAVVCGQGLFYRGLVTDIALHSDKFFTSNVFHAVQHAQAAIEKVIEDNNVVTRCHQFDAGMRANVASPSSDKYGFDGC
jgi:hypothetical protein